MATATVVDPDSPEFWLQRKVKAQLTRMRESGRVAARVARTKAEKALVADFFSEHNVRMRVRLLADPDVSKALDTIWDAADADGSGKLERAEYLQMHRKLCLALDPGTQPRKALNKAREDWVRDSEGKTGLDKERFTRCWFELADMYTDSIEPRVYVEFLTSTMRDLTRVNERGEAHWASDREVLDSYFERRRRESGDLDGGVSSERRHHLINLWEEELKKDDAARK